MEMTLLLNSTYEPLRVVHWQKAISLLWQGKVEVLEVYDREIHGVSISFKLPAVMRLLKLVRLKDSHRAVKFSRINIFTRDGYVCQYCRTKYRTEELTFDHVVPVATSPSRLPARRAAADGVRPKRLARPTSGLSWTVDRGATTNVPSHHGGTP